MVRIAIASLLAVLAFWLSPAPIHGEPLPGERVPGEPAAGPASPPAPSGCTLANGALDERVAACTRLIRAGAGSKRELSLAAAYRGNAYRAKGDTARALGDYNDAIRLDPTNAEAFNFRGLELYGRGDLGRAVADFTEAIRLDPGMPRAFANRGQVYLGRGDFGHAVADFSEAITLDANFARAFAGRGQAYAAMGDPEHAIADFTEVIRVSPENVAALTNRGLAYESKHDLARARADFSAAMAQLPRDTAAALARDLARQRLAILAAAKPEMAPVRNLPVAVAPGIPLASDDPAAPPAALPPAALPADIRPIAPQRAGVVPELAFPAPAAPEPARPPAAAAVPRVTPAPPGTVAPVLGPPEKVAAAVNGLVDPRGTNPATAEPPAHVPALSRERNGVVAAAAGPPAPNRPLAVAAPGPPIAGPGPPSTGATAQPADRTGRRVALVIGNSSYLTLQYVPNPLNDAADMAAALRQLGFAVTLGLDLRRGDMEDVLAKFGGEARAAATALVYYSGRGLQHMGESYLLPIDARVRDEADVRRLIKLTDVVAAMAGASRDRILILDASRANEAGPVGTPAERVFGRGLAKLPAVERTLEISAAQPNQVVAETKGRNSLFTQALLKRIQQSPGMKALVNAARADLMRASGGAQNPDVADGLAGELALRAGN
jgi:tetratricopeptide (TPR) repeat protein